MKVPSDPESQFRHALRNEINCLKLSVRAFTLVPTRQDKLLYLDAIEQCADKLAAMVRDHWGPVDIEQKHDADKVGHA